MVVVVVVAVVAVVVVVAAVLDYCSTGATCAPTVVCHDDARCDKNTTGLVQLPYHTTAVWTALRQTCRPPRLSSCRSAVRSRSIMDRSRPFILTLKNVGALSL